MGPSTAARACRRTAQLRRRPLPRTGQLQSTLRPPQLVARLLRLLLPLRAMLGCRPIRRRTLQRRSPTATTTAATAAARTRSLLCPRRCLSLLWRGVLARVVAFTTAQTDSCCPALRTSRRSVARSLARCWLPQTPPQAQSLPTSAWTSSERAGVGRHCILPSSCFSRGCLLWSSLSLVVGLAVVQCVCSPNRGCWLCMMVVVLDPRCLSGRCLNVSD